MHENGQKSGGDCISPVVFILTKKQFKATLSSTNLFCCPKGKSVNTVPPWTNKLDRPRVPLEEEKYSAISV